MGKVLISVIVPVFNTESNLLDKAVNSLLNQTIGNVEVVLADDGSTNVDTLNALNEWENKGLCVLHLPNRGQGAARNVAFKHIHGDFVGFLDSDDWLDENFYEVLHDLCVKDGSDIACGALLLEYPDRKEYLDKPRKGVETELKKKLERVNNGSCCTKLFRRELIDKARFPEEYYYEDNTMLAEMLIHSGRVSYTSDVCYHYFQNGISTVHNPLKEHKRESDGIAILAYIKGLAMKLPHEDGSVLVTKFFDILMNRDKYATNHFYHVVIDALLADFVREKPELKPLEKVFSLVNCKDKRYKMLTILGISIKFKRRKQQSV